MRVHQQPAFVLLNRAYSESSWVSELFTRDYGRLAVMAKGARRQKSPIRGVLLPFQPLLVSWSGKGEVPTLVGGEIQANKIDLVKQELCGEALICGFYCNELISYLLHRFDPHATLFDAYASTLTRLAVVPESQLSAELRSFEQQVIRETGYEVNFAHEAGNKVPIEADKHYEYLPGEGFRRCPDQHHNAVSGRVVLALNGAVSSDLTSSEISLSKQLMRAILRQSLGHRQINSRNLFLRSLEAPQ